MDNKRKLRGATEKSGRFNIVDLLLVILSLAIIGALLLMFDPFSFFAKDATREVKLRYTVEIKDVSNEMKNNVSAGDKALNFATDYDMGTVVAVEPQSSFEWVYNEGDEYMSKKYKTDKSDLIITIDVDAVYSEGTGYMVDGKHIAVGSQVSLRFPSFTGTGYCISIEQVN